MKATIDLAKRISKDLTHDWQPDFEDINTWHIFGPLFKKYSYRVANTLSAFLIFAYDNDSRWLNFEQDRRDNKVRILQSLEANPVDHPYCEVIDNKDPDFAMLIALYLQSQVTHKWKRIIVLLDYSAEMLLQASKKPADDKRTQLADKEGQIKELVEEFDTEKMNKINMQRYDLMERSERARNDADRLMAELSKDFLQLNQVTKTEFGFEMTEEKDKQLYYENWREWIRNYVLPIKKEAKK